MKDEWLSEGEIEVSTKVVAVDRNVKLDSLLGLSFLEFPHGSLNLNGVGLEEVRAVISRDKRRV